MATTPIRARTRAPQQTLATITADDLKALHRRLFARDNLIVGVVGAIDAETLKKELDLLFGGLPEKAELTPVADTELKLGQEIDVPYDLPQTTLRFAFPGVDRNKPEYFAAYLMNHILGGGDFSSRLFTEVREKRGLAYSVGSSLVNYDHASALVISTATRSDRAAETIKVIRDAGEADGRKGRDGTRNWPTPRNTSSAPMPSTIWTRRRRSPARWSGCRPMASASTISSAASTCINEVTLDEVQAAARKLLSVEPAVMVLGPAIKDGGKG